MRTSLLFLTFSFSFIAQAQDGISTSVSRTVTLPPDEANYTIVVGTTLDASQQQVLDALQTAGISAPSLLAVAAGPTNYGYPPQTDAQAFYQFAVTTPASALKDTTKKLEGLRAAPPDFVKSVQYSSSLNASQQAIDDMRGKVLPQLFADARKKADALASAAGLKLGSVTAVNEYSAPVYVNTGFFLQSVAGGVLSSSSSNGTGVQITYSVMVRYTAQ